MLEKIDFFEGLADAEIQQIESAAERRKYEKGTVILKEDDATDYLYILLSGQVHAYLDDEEGKRIIVNSIGPYELFGELAMFSGDKRSANIRAVETCEVIIIQREVILQAVTELPTLCCNLVKRLAKKINALTEDVSCLALMDNYGRIARLLNQHARENDHGYLLTGQLTQQEIADRIGSSREMVSRILKDLRIGGYIDIEKKRIKLLKPLPKGW